MLIEPSSLAARCTHHKCSHQKWPCRTHLYTTSANCWGGGLPYPYTLEAWIFAGCLLMYNVPQVAKRRAVPIIHSVMCRGTFCWEGGRFDLTNWPTIVTKKRSQKILWTTLLQHGRLTFDNFLTSLKIWKYCGRDAPLPAHPWFH